MAIDLKMIITMVMILMTFQAAFMENADQDKGVSCMLNDNFDNQCVSINRNINVKMFNRTSDSIMTL